MPFNDILDEIRFFSTLVTTNYKQKVHKNFTELQLYTVYITLIEHLNNIIKNPAVV